MSLSLSLSRASDSSHEGLVTGIPRDKGESTTWAIPGTEKKVSHGREDLFPRVPRTAGVAYSSPSRGDVTMRVAPRRYSKGGYERDMRVGSP